MTVLANCFRYQPNFGPIFESVRTEQPTSIQESLFVGLAVLSHKVHQNPRRRVASELRWRLTIPLERFQMPAASIDEMTTKPSPGNAG